MKKITLILPFVSILLAIAVAVPVIGAPSAGIIVTDADASWEDSVSIAQELTSYVADINPRFVVHSANALKETEVDTLHTALETLIGQSDPKITILSANANHTFLMSYPRDLIEDNIQPKISDLTSNGSGLIQWTTDEFAICEVRYGAEPSKYIYTASDPLYKKSHEFTLSKISSGAIYYKITCTDRSDNSIESSEHNFSISFPIYLPLTLYRLPSSEQ